MESDCKATLHKHTTSKTEFKRHYYKKAVHTYIKENKVSSRKSTLFHDRFSQQPVYISIYFSQSVQLLIEYAFRTERCHFHSS